MKTLLAFLLLQSSALATTLYSPDLPAPLAPSDYLHVTFDVNAPVRAQYFGGEPFIDVVDDSLWMPRRPYGAAYDAWNGLLNLRLDGRAWWELSLRPELDLDAITFTAVPVDGDVSPFLLRDVTITAPGYYRAFRGTLAPEPSGIVLALIGLVSLRRSQTTQ